MKNFDFNLDFKLYEKLKWNFSRVSHYNGCNTTRPRTVLAGHEILYLARAINRVYTVIVKKIFRTSGNNGGDVWMSRVLIIVDIVVDFLLLENAKGSNVPGEIYKFRIA